jgi:hypothetical protein
VSQTDDILTVQIDESNFAEIRLTNQQVTYKTEILGGFTLSEKMVGEINFRDFFRIEWPNDQSIPELTFKLIPISIQREYKKGMNLEFGIEDVQCYQVMYEDDVIAKFHKTRDQAYEFNFSTGFDGSFWKDRDGSHLIRFKGLNQTAELDDYTNESKFIISRSKYTDNLILILTEDAIVRLV